MEEFKKINCWTKKKKIFLSRSLKRRELPAPPLKLFKGGEIWWCAVGMNVGTEIYGKGELFLRPVLVLKKTGRYSFVGIPSSTKGLTRDERIFYGPYEFIEGIPSIFLFGQVRAFDAERLQERIGVMPDSVLHAVRTKFYDFLFK